TVTAAASAKVAAVLEGVMKAMFLTKMKTALVVLVTVLGLGTGVGLMTGVSRNAVVAQENKGTPLPTEATKLRVQELIQQLGADEFQKREQATKELKALGKEIVPQLEAALKTSESPEVPDGWSSCWLRIGQKPISRYSKGRGHWSKGTSM